MERNYSIYVSVNFIYIFTICLKLCVSSYVYIYIYIFVVFYMPKYIFVYKRRITVLVTSIPQGVSSIAHQSMTACLHRKLPSAATFH